MADQPHDPPAPGPSAALARAMVDDGIDLTDEGAVTAWIEDFNARPFDERAQVIAGRRRLVAPLALPDGDELVDAVRRAPTMVQLAALVEWIGDGRALTGDGELTVADGTHLVDVLGTGDRVVPTVGGRTVTTTRAAAFGGVDVVFRLALASRLVRRDEATVRPTARGGALLDPGGSAGVLPEIWRAVVTALLDVGAVSGGWTDNADLAWWEADLDAGVPDLLCTCGIAGTGVWAAGMLSAALDRIIGTHDIMTMPEAHRATLPAAVAHSITNLVDRLSGLGIVSCEDLPIPSDRWTEDVPVSTRIELTVLGNWFVRPLLVARGFEVPALGQHARAAADDLLDAIAPWEPVPFAAEVRLWSAQRSAPVDELIAVAVAAPTLERRTLVFDALHALGEEAMAAVRTAVALPILRPFAIGWLMEYDAEPDGALDVGDDPRTLVEVLAVILVTLGPDAMCTLQNGHGSGESQLAAIEGLWRVNDPYVEPVLEALAGHRVEPVAKAARRALFKVRNLG